MWVPHWKRENEGETQPVDSVPPGAMLAVVVGRKGAKKKTDMATTKHTIMPLSMTLFMPHIRMQGN